MSSGCFSALHSVSKDLPDECGAAVQEPADWECQPVVQIDDALDYFQG